MGPQLQGYDQIQGVFQCAAYGAKMAIYLLNALLVPVLHVGLHAYPENDMGDLPKYTAPFSGFELHVGLHAYPENDMGDLSKQAAPERRQTPTR
jgi:hypothetical protein